MSTISFAQVDDEQVNSINRQLDSIENVRKSLIEQMELVKLQWIQKEMKRIGYPVSAEPQEIIEHSAIVLSYNEEHEQANWVMHIILPEIIEGNVSRTNDFRVDTLVPTGSAEEKDYFLKVKQDNGKYKYDGFGYDRGHLAPSADFKWSRKALSETYFYSNMSPQLGDFNRQKWAQLERWMRSYVENEHTHLYIVTAPILTPDLPKQERSINQISIPQYFVKIALDLKNKRGIAFIMPHQKITVPIENYAVSIDSAEAVLGYDVFSELDDKIEVKIEASNEYKYWMPGKEKDDVKPIEQKKLPKNTLSTYNIHVFVDDGKKHTVCGKVVSTKKHDKGHVFINLDKKFPNQVFSVSIFSQSIKNFSYQPENYLKDKDVCFTGEIGDYKGTPSMVIEDEKEVKLLKEMK